MMSMESPMMVLFIISFIVAVFVIFIQRFKYFLPCDMEISIVLFFADFIIFLSESS